MFPWSIQFWKTAYILKGKKKSKSISGKDFYYYYYICDV